jgi:hypothetical protein
MGVCDFTASTDQKGVNPVRRIERHFPRIGLFEFPARHSQRNHRQPEEHDVLDEIAFRGIGGKLYGHCRRVDEQHEYDVFQNHAEGEYSQYNGLRTKVWKMSGTFGQDRGTKPFCSECISCNPKQEYLSYDIESELMPSAARGEHQGQNAEHGE